MRITDIELYSSAGVEALTFSVQKASVDEKYYITNIVGLDAEELIPRYYGAGLVTKPKYYDFTMKPRIIVMKFRLNPNFAMDETVSDLRDDLYKIISASRTGKVSLNLISLGSIMAVASGFITKFEATYFTDKPELTITVQCDDPMLRGVNRVIYDDATLVNSNPIVILDTLSTAPHGFAIQVTFTAVSSTFTIQSAASNPEWKFLITPSGGFAINDVLYLSSDKLNKYLYMVRSGVTTHLMDKVELTSLWPMIFPGSNTFYIPEIANLDLDQIDFYPAYWGV
jgi:hypothetical protein